MLTGRAAELRPDINYLAVRPIVLVTPEQARYDALSGPAPIENAETLRTRGRQANLRRAKRIGETNQGRDIPVGGQARRRAKAIRNHKAAATIDWGDLPAGTAPFTVVRGRQYEGDTIPPGGILDEIRDTRVSNVLVEVLAWCQRHPFDGALPVYGELRLRRHADDSVSLEGDAPDVIAISSDLLAEASPDHLSFTDGVLAITVQPEMLRYMPIGPDPRRFAVVFERIQETL